MVVGADGIPCKFLQDWSVIFLLRVISGFSFQSPCILGTVLPQHLVDSGLETGYRGYLYHFNWEAVPGIQHPSRKAVDLQQLIAFLQLEFVPVTPRGRRDRQMEQMREFWVQFETDNSE